MIVLFSVVGASMSAMSRSCFGFDKPDFLYANRRGLFRRRARASRSIDFIVSALLTMLLAREIC
jgi:hypothetical protein